MNRALYIAKTGLEAQTFRLATISNNIANANTTGYKTGRAEFVDLLYQNVRQPGAQATQDENTTLPSGLQLGAGVRPIAVHHIHTQGNAQITDAELDVMIQGKGFFQALDPNGETLYTRDGSFQLNQDGDLVTSSGNLVEPGISVPNNATQVFISLDGLVTAQITGNTQPTQLGQLTIATFINPEGLSNEGDNFYRETIASGDPSVKNPGTEEAGTFLQGALEASNVNTVAELIGLIEAQRTYEMNSKAISTSDEMMQYLNNNT